MSELLALLDDREVGVVNRKNGRMTFTYADAWRHAPGAYPLSLSMPMAAADHPHAAIDTFLWGLLPDNEAVLRSWANRFHISARNVLALIAEVGEDCAGAVQFIRPERREQLSGQSEADINWLTEADVASRLRALQTDASATRAPGDAGHFSLAGAQPKTALVFDGQRWGVPSGREATTHILKPQTGEFAGHAENEHLCLALARALGLPCARSEVHRFEDVTAIVIQRYDRVRIADLAMQRSAQSLSAFAKTPATYRVHQEDFCQALRVHPFLKYQNEGGPGPKQIVDLLRAHAAGAQSARGRDAATTYDEDVATFLDALILNWLIGGTDAHAKNYSILIGAGGLVRLAPLYDIASALAYPAIDPRKAKLAMKIGGEYRLHEIGLTQWRTLAADVRVDADALVDRVRAMAGALPDCLADEVGKLRAAGFEHRIIDTLAKVLPVRATRIARA